MSQADELLENLVKNKEQPTSYTLESEGRPHIVVGKDRFITVPYELQKIAVEHDHNVETVTFDCPRYWNGLDMSTMKIFVNYMRSDEQTGSYIVDNIAVDSVDTSIMHFDWTITEYASYVQGPLRFLVCIKKADGEGSNLNHWNSELNEEMYVSEGLEVDVTSEEPYPDLITQILTRLDVIEHDVVESVNTAKESAMAYTDQNASALIQYIHSIIKPYDLAWTDGGYISRYDGSVNAEEGSSYSNFVSVEPGAKLIIYNTMTTDTEYNVFYDSEQNYLTSFSTDNGSVVTVPDGAKYFRLSKHTTDTVTVLPEVVMKKPKATTIDLPISGWTGSNLLYSQTVSVPIVKENSQVDLRPSPTQLQELLTSEISLTAANESGSVTIFAIGGKPISDYTMQIIVSEVELV